MQGLLKRPGYRLYPPDSPEAGALLAEQGLRPADLDLALAELARTEGATVRSIVGINEDGVFGTSRERWHPDLPDAGREPLIPLQRGGLDASTVAREAIAGRNLARLERQGVALICLSYVNPAATQHAHRLTRRLRQHFGPEARIMVGLWGAKPAPEAREELLRAVGADLLATTLGQAVRQIAEAAEPVQPKVPSAA
jgi:hypothetical protein